MVNLIRPKNFTGSPLSKAADILFPAIADSMSVSRRRPPASRNTVEVRKHAVYQPVARWPGGAVKDAMYNGSLLIRLLQG